MNDTHTQAFVAQVLHQRNEAMTGIASLCGDVAVLNEKLAEAEARWNDPAQLRERLKELEKGGAHA